MLRHLSPRRRPAFEVLEDRTVPAVAVGSPFPVNTTTANVASLMHTAANHTGHMVAAWVQSTNPGGNPNVSRVRAQRFDAAGQKLGPEIVVTGANPIDSTGGLDVAI